jgi:A118 family predicted phage portal protein
LAFLKEGYKFPPQEWEYWHDKYREWKAWYSGDPNDLIKFYTINTPKTSLNELNNIFWARLDAEERSTSVHFPIASDIPSMSSNLLFAEPPRYQYDKEGKAGERIKEFIDENGWQNVLLESSEIAAALSGCFLKLDIDKSVSKLPLVNIITPEQCFPKFNRGRLWEILFYRVVKEEEKSNKVYRLFENRRKTDDRMGVIIEYKLYVGNDQNIGKEINIESFDDDTISGLKDIVIDKVDGLGVVYVPNVRPNKLLPGSILGVNDYFGCISLLDSLDFAWTSWMRDIELGMGQVFIDEELMSRTDTTAFGSEKSMLNKFSKFQKCFLKLNFSQYRMGGENTKPIDIVQFEMRVDEHAKTCMSLMQSIIDQCGYSLSTFGLDTEGRAESGTALRIRERKSLLTRGKKGGYWLPAIKSLLMQMQQMDNALNVVYYDPLDISVELEDSIIVDAKELSETVKNYDMANALSQITKVKMIHPEWNDEEIEAEVNRINDESGITTEQFPLEVKPERPLEVGK